MLIALYDVNVLLIVLTKQRDGFDKKKMFVFGFPSLSKRVEASLNLPSTFNKPFYSIYKINYAGYISSTPSRVYVIIR